MARRTDAINLTGITSLMNKTKIKPGLDLDKCENEVIGFSAKKENKPDDMYNIDAEINKLASSLGLDLGKTDIQAKKITGVVDLKHSSSEEESDSEEDSYDSEEGSDESYDSEEGSSYVSGSDGSEVSGSDGSDVSGSDGSEVSGSDVSGSSDNSRTRHMHRMHDKLHIRTSHRNEVSVPRRNHRHRDTDDVLDRLNEDEPSAAGMSRERLMDDKARKIEKIQQLYGALEEDGIDCSKITIPSTDNSIHEIDAVLSTLQLKNDRNRYSTLANEVIMGMAEVVEAVFNGERAIPLTGYRPDYTNYPATVSVKLHRMKYETSQVVSDFINEHKIGIKTRIGLELLPSFLLYPSQQARNKKEKGLNNDSLRTKSRLAAISNIRKSDMNADINDINNI